MITYKGVLRAARIVLDQQLRNYPLNTSLETRVFLHPYCPEAPPTVI